MNIFTGSIEIQMLCWSVVLGLAQLVIATSLATWLTMMGLESRVAADGIEALELARTHRPDAILLDLGMPGRDGYEVCREIRAQPWGASMLVIALTGWGREEDRRRTKEAGFDQHLVKPVDYAALMGLLSIADDASRTAEAG